MSEISTEAVISAMDSLLPRRAAAHTFMSGAKPA